MADRRADLKSFTASLRRMLDSDPDNEAFFEPGVARRVLEALEGFTAPGRQYKTLDHAFGYSRSRGRKTASESEAVPDRLVQAWRMAIAGTPWNGIAEAIGHSGDPNDLRKMVERYHPAISRAEAERVYREWFGDAAHGGR